MVQAKTQIILQPHQTIDAAFKDVHEFYVLDLQDLKDKERYVRFKANEAQSGRLHNVLEELQQIERQNKAANAAKAKVTRLRETLEKAERKYADQTISEIELIFHIYSGRLIQNCQRGLGLFIESGEGKQLRFLTAEKSDHDAIMSMSSGQVSALSLAFFLSLNKVYADVPLILVDGPSQSLDEVNIASLTDLLRCELNHCQLLVSSHEEDISAYMRYRFNKAGLKTKSLNMQRLARTGMQWLPEHNSGPRKQTTAHSASPLWSWACPHQALAHVLARDRMPFRIMIKLWCLGTSSLAPLHYQRHGPY